MRLNQIATKPNLARLFNPPEAVFEHKPTSLAAIFRSVKSSMKCLSNVLNCFGNVLQNKNIGKTNPIFKQYRRPSLFADFLSVNSLISFEKWPKMTLFQSKMDFLSANSRFAVQNDRTYLPLITRETCITIKQGPNSQNFLRKICKIFLSSKCYSKVVVCNRASFFDFYSNHYQTLIIRNWFNSLQTWHLKD